MELNILKLQNIFIVLKIIPTKLLFDDINMAMLTDDGLYIHEDKYNLIKNVGIEEFKQILGNLKVRDMRGLLPKTFQNDLHKPMKPRSFPKNYGINNVMIFPKKLWYQY